MNQNQVINKDLPLSSRVEMLIYLIMNVPFTEFTHQLNNNEIIALQKFVWDKTVEIGLRLKGKAFSRKDITKGIVSTPVYQRAQNCSERVYYCKGIMCIHANSSCARNKISEHLHVMQDSIQQWLRETNESKLNLNGITP